MFLSAAGGVSALRRYPADLPHTQKHTNHRGSSSTQLENGHIVPAEHLIASVSIKGKRRRLYLADTHHLSARVQQES